MSQRERRLKVKMRHDLIAYAESSPPPSTDEPDPRAVIDWLLKDRR